MSPYAATTGHSATHRASSIIVGSIDEEKEGRRLPNPAFFDARWIANRRRDGSRNNLSSEASMNAKKPKRPILVWVVFLYYLVTIVPGAGGLLFVWHSAPFSANARMVVESMTTLAWALLGLTSALELGGAIALFKLRRIAFPLFVGAFGCTILQMSMQHQENTVSGPVNYLPALGLAIELFVCAYAWRLRSRSALT
jgi:hypothetical protein